MKNILDVPLIQNYLHDKHTSFIKDVGDVSIKIAADRELVKTRLCAKIYRILECFVEEKIIDEISVKEDSLYKCFHLIKKDHEKSIYLWTDGVNIVLEDNSLFIRSGLNAPFKRVFYNVNVDEHDWLAFSKELLNYIHIVIYNRAAAYEAKIFR